MCILPNYVYVVIFTKKPGAYASARFLSLFADWNGEGGGEYSEINQKALCPFKMFEGLEFLRIC